MKPSPRSRTKTAAASPTQSLDRAIGLLEQIAGQAREGMALTQLARATSLSKATTHRLLAGLKGLGLVDYDASSRRFLPGLKLYRMGVAASARFDMARIAGDSLSRLANETADTVYLSLRLNDDSICVARREGGFPIKTLTLSVGDIRPLGLGAGSLALLAFLPDSEIDRAMERNRPRLARHPNYDSASLKRLVKETRERGFALNDGMMLSEMAAVGVPVRQPDGEVIAAISVAAIRNRMGGARRATIVRLLKAEAKAIEAALGGARAST